MTARIRTIAFVLAFFLSLSFFTACSKTESDITDNSSCTVTCAEILNECMAIDSTLPEMVTYTDGLNNGSDVFSAFTDESMDMVSDFAYAYASDGSAPEIIIIKLKSTDDVLKMMRSLSSHMETRKNGFAEYTPEQVEMVEKGCLGYEGVYIGYFINNKSALMQKTLSEKVK